MVAFAGVVLIVIIGAVIIIPAFYGYRKLTRYQETKEHQETRWAYIQKRHYDINNDHLFK
jgi:hypothetical protein